MRPPNWFTPLLMGAVPRLGAGLIRIYGVTMHINRFNEESVLGMNEREEPYVLAFWHGRLLMMPHCYRGRRIRILISLHQDGEMIARTMVRLGFGTIRGSSSRGGSSAIRELVRALQRGEDIAITPDGPRGPVQEVQPGVLQVAQLSGRPIVPVSFGAYPARRLHSWDRFVVPYPWSRGAFAWGQPIFIPRDADTNEQEQWRSRLKRALDLLSERTDRYCSGEIQEVKTDDL